jgi:nicotinamide-nucleotide amidase
MRIEVINTGTEILLGHVTNTHLGFLAQSLFRLGWRIERQITVPDGVAIAEAFEVAMGRSDLIIVTGGLGPTSDDLTRDAAAEAFGLELVFHQEILDGIAARFAQRKLVMNELQRSQALVPKGGVVLENNFGTAPGLILQNHETVAILLPGPPRELRPMWENDALPWLRRHFHEKLAPLHEISLRVLGVGESRVQLLVEEEIRALGPIEIGYCARPGEVDLRLISTDQTLVQRGADLARAKLGRAIYAAGNETMEHTVVRLLRAGGKTVATAESCTGGLVASRITDVPGSSAVFRSGWVTYADEAKTRELGVPAELIQKHGAVSAEVAAALADGALRESGADLAVAVTGIAGPEAVEGKPVGLVYFGLAVRGGETRSEERTLGSSREGFKGMAAQIALDLVRRALESGKEGNDLR